MRFSYFSFIFWGYRLRLIFTILLLWNLVSISLAQASLQICQHLAQRQEWDELLQICHSSESTPIETSFEISLLRTRALTHTQPDSAVFFGRQALNMARTHALSETSYIGRAWHNIGNAHLAVGDYPAAGKAFWQSLQYTESMADSSMAKLYNSLGLYHQNNDLSDSTTHYYQLAIEHWTPYPTAINRHYPTINLAATLPVGEERRTLLEELAATLDAEQNTPANLSAATALHLAETFLLQGKSAAAEVPLGRAQDLLQSASIPSDLQIRINLASARWAQSIDDPEQTDAYLSQIDALLPHSAIDPSTYIDFLLLRSRQYISHGVYQDAQKTLSLVIDLCYQYKLTHSSSLAECYLLRAQLYIEQEQWSGAIYYLRLAKQSMPAQASYHWLVALSCNTSLVYRNTGQADKALIVLQKLSSKHGKNRDHLHGWARLQLEKARALLMLSRLDDALNIVDEILDIKWPNDQYNTQFEVACLQLKAEILQQQGQLILSHSTFEQAIDLLGHYWQQQRSKTSIYRDRYRYDELFAQAISLTTQLAQEDNRYLDRAFLILEKSKLSLLRRPSHLESNRNQSSKGVAATFVSELQSKLLPEQALLAYFWHPSAAHAFVLTKDSLSVYPIQAAQQIDSLIKIYYPLIATSPWKWEEKMDQQIAKTYQVGGEIYKQLLAPFADLLPSQIILIPDGLLHFLPFPALNLREDGDFLLKKYQFSQHFSPGRWLDNQRPVSKQSRDQLLALCPSFENDSRGLIPLSGSKQEQQLLEQLFDGTFLMGKAATEEAFQKHRRNANILHFGSHGYYDNSNPYRSFIALTERTDSVENEYLYVEEIAALQQSFKLVVMSACETAFGLLRRGEGLLSLTYAFYQNKTSNIIATQWQVSDGSSAEIIADFYGNLAQGDNSISALQLAQKAYLKQADSHISRHPFYWAAYVHFGNGSTINLPRNRYAIEWWLLLSLIVGIGVWFIRKQKR